MSRSTAPSMQQQQQLNAQQQQQQQQQLQALQHLQALSQNVLQHKMNEKKYSFEYLGIHTTRQEIVKMFGGIRFIAIMGPESRAQLLANACVQKLNIAKQYSQIGESEFFNIFRVGPILSCSHGMGLSSICLFLNELLRIMQISKNNDFEIIRLGSSGGIGVEGGTLVITTHALDPISMKPEWTFYSCGHAIKQECIFNKQIYKRLYAISKAKKYQVEYGKTVSTETYYEAQARLDGALCEYSEKEKGVYLHTLHKNGVRNFEMEATVLSGICTRNNLKCGMIAVAYVNRLKEDTVPSKYTPKEIKSWMDNAIDVLLQYIYQFVLKK